MKYEETARRIRLALNNKGMKAIELAERTGIGRSSISHYVNGSHEPSNVTAYKMANVLDVNPAWLMGFDVPMIEEGYYSTDTAQVAQEIFENNELRLLFDEARTASQEDLRTAHAMLLALKRKEKGID